MDRDFFTQEINSIKNAVACCTGKIDVLAESMSMLEISSRSSSQISQASKRTCSSFDSTADADSGNVQSAALWDTDYDQPGWAAAATSAHNASFPPSESEAGGLQTYTPVPGAYALPSSSASPLLPSSALTLKPHQCLLCEFQFKSRGYKPPQLCLLTQLIPSQSQQNAYEESFRSELPLQILDGPPEAHCVARRS